MNCLNCNKELDNPRAKFCSDKCRMAYKRRTKQPEQQPEQIDPNKPKRPEQITRTKRPEQIKPEQKLKNYTAQDLYLSIDTYPADTWKDSPEFKELMRRLKTLSVKKLEEQSFSIPAWKRGVSILK